MPDCITLQTSQPSNQKAFSSIAKRQRSDQPHSSFVPLRLEFAAAPWVRLTGIPGNCWGNVKANIMQTRGWAAVPTRRANSGFYFPNRAESSRMST
jgi:hypothetical protein